MVIQGIIHVRRFHCDHIRMIISYAYLHTALQETLSIWKHKFYFLVTKKFTITISYGNIILIYSRQRRKLGNYKYFSNMKSQIEACIQLFSGPYTMIEWFINHTLYGYCGRNRRDLNQSKSCVWGWLRLKDWDWKIDFYF